MTTRELIEAAMRELENMPCGGVGYDGPSRELLTECDKDGQPYEDNSEFHQSQSAWLYLNEALRQL